MKQRTLRKHDLPWPKSIKEAIEIQQQLVQRLEFCDLQEEPNLIAGVDCSAHGNSNLMTGAVVVWERSTNTVVDQAYAIDEVEFPYLPGLLAFRELPVLLAAFNNLQTRPEVVICDGQGTAHMRGFGLACHLGLYLDLPTVGCGKTRLVGSYEQPSPVKGAESDLVYRGQLVGKVVCTKDQTNPVFVSAGCYCSLPSAVQVVLMSCRRYKLPEPIRHAHKLCGTMLKQYLALG